MAKKKQTKEKVEVPVVETPVVETTINLSFKELELITRERALEGY